MFENRVPHMLESDWHPLSALDILVKDMVSKRYKFFGLPVTDALKGIVTSSARGHQFPLLLSSVAEQLYISAASQGYGRQDDSGIVRTYLLQTPAALYDHAGGTEAGDDTESSIQLISKLLEGVHLAAAAEAMAFAAKLGLDTQSLYVIIRAAASGSSMFENRVPAILKGNWTPQSTLATVVENLVC
jgi:3-hydroxyisobutyrate dehydrogenase